MGWVIALTGCALSGAVAYWMGVRAERGRHARWDSIQEAVREDRRRTGGIILKRLRIER